METSTQATSQVGSVKLDRFAFGNQIIKKATDSGISFQSLNEMISSRYGKISKDLEDHEMIDLMNHLEAAEAKSKMDSKLSALANQVQTVKPDQSDLSAFDELVSEINMAVEPVLAMKITDEDSAARVMEAGKQVKRLLKKVEDRHHSLKAPILEAGRSVDSRAKEVSKPLKKAEEHLQNENLQWNKVVKERAEAQRRKIEEDRRKLDEENRKKELEAKVALETAQMFGSEEQIAGVAQKVAENFDQKEAAEKALATQEKRIAQTARVKGIRQYWTHKIIDPMKIPREYLMVNESAIIKAINANSSGGSCSLQIPGVEIFQTEKMSFRG